MEGTLYGIGVGPGDPELLTIKAINALKRCDVIAAPKSSATEQAAYDIVKQYIQNKKIIDCVFSMQRNIQQRAQERSQVAHLIAQQLRSGQNVGFITLGDPGIYSTYTYIHKILSKHFNCQIIPGVPSFCAAAAVLNTALCEGEELLTIIPGAHCPSIHEVLASSGNKIIMKSGKSIADVVETLQHRQPASAVQMVERCGMKGQRIINDPDEMKSSGYFSTILIRGERT